MWGRTSKMATLGTAFFLVPNLVIALMHRWARRANPGPAERIPVRNFAEVDERLWRGAAPTEDALEALAAEGVTTVVDLRAEDRLEANDALAQRLGISRAYLPVRDGQAPTRERVEDFLDVVAGSRGRVFVHCGAGVGRTGTMAAAYLVATGQATAHEAVERNLSVGPPSVEQLAFTALLGTGEVRRPPTTVVAFSRAVDGPRRLWARLRSSQAPRISA